MRSLRRFLTRLYNLATRRTHEERLREEIEEHIALQRVSGNSTRSGGIDWYRSSVIVAGLLATWIPAQRALSVNPAVLLREE